MVSLHISEYKNIINELRSEIDSLKIKLHGNNLNSKNIEILYSERI